MALVEYPVSDEWVHEMLWARSNPKHVRHDYGKLEMMAYFASQWKAEEMAFFADKEKGVLLRVEILSPLHIGIHVMGDGTKIRSVLREGVALTFEHFKFDVILLTTLDKRLVAIQKACGFKIVAEIPQHVYLDGQLHDVTLMQYTREMYLEQRNRRPAPDGVPQVSHEEAA